MDTTPDPATPRRHNEKSEENPLARWRERVLRTIQDAEGGTTMVPLSQEAAARRCGFSRQTWAAWEARTRPITLQQANKISEVLGLSNEERLELLEWGRQPLIRDGGEIS